MNRTSLAAGHARCLVPVGLLAGVALTSLRPINADVPPNVLVVNTDQPPDLLYAQQVDHDTGQPLVMVNPILDPLDVRNMTLFGLVDHKRAHGATSKAETQVPVADKKAFVAQKKVRRGATAQLAGNSKKSIGRRHGGTIVHADTGGYHMLN